MQKKRGSKKGPTVKRPSRTVSAKKRKQQSAECLADGKLSRSIISNSPIVITILDKDGKIVYTNPSISQVHFLNKTELENRNMLKSIHPDDVSTTKKMFNRALKSRGSVDFGVIRVHLMDGTYHSFRCSSKSIEDSTGGRHIVVYSSDITTQVNYGKALADSEERYRMLADTAHDMIFIVNRKGIVEYVNKSSAKEFKKTPDRLIGKPLSDLFPSYTSKRQEVSLGKVFKTGKPYYIANDTPFPQGQKMLDTWLMPIKDENGEVKSVFGVSRDVTNYKRIELELKQKKEETEAAKARAQVYFDFLAHDIANLISPILTYSESLIKTGLSDPEAMEHLGSIFNQTQRTARLIMDLRMLAEAEKIPPESSDGFDLGKFFLDIQRMVSQEHSDKCNISIALPKSGSAVVIGGMHTKNAFMLGFSDAMGTHSGACVDINVKMHLVKKGTRQYWQVRMEMPNRPMATDWGERVIPPFDPGRRMKSRGVDSVSFASGIISHFGGKMWDEPMDKKDPSKGHTIVVELPKAGTWHNTRNT